MTLISLEVFSFATTWPLNVNEPMEDPLAPAGETIPAAHMNVPITATPARFANRARILLLRPCPIGF